MAAIKTIKTQHGVDASYHKLVNVKMSVEKDLIEMQFAIYASAEARDAGAIPLWNEYISFKLSEVKPSPLELLYPLAMQAEYFAGATPDQPATLDILKHEVPVVVEVPDLNAIAKAEALARPKPTGVKNGS